MSDAVRTPPIGAGHGAGAVLVFVVGPHRCALPLAVVREVQRAVALVEVPCAPPSVEGGVCVRGTLVPVVDLRRRLGLPPRGVALSDHLIVADHAGRAFALRVEAVEGLDTVDVPGPAPSPGPGAPADGAARGALDFVDGARVLPDGLVLLHHPAALLAGVGA